MARLPFGMMISAQVFDVHPVRAWVVYVSDINYIQALMVDGTQLPSYGAPVG